MVRPPGPAYDVLQVGELPDPHPAAGEVRVRLTVSGVNPGDTKKRSGWLETPMAFPRIIPHSDGAGVIDAVGADVEQARLGQRVWVYGAQSYRPSGTAAQLTVVPEHQAVALPPNVTNEVGASLGIPGITAHRAVFNDGPVAGKCVLVHGVLGAVGSMAAQLARRGGALVIGTVRHTGDLAAVDSAVADRTVALDQDDAAATIRELTPAGLERVVEVSLSDNLDLDAAVVANGAVIAAYGSRVGRPSVPFWPLLFANVTLRLLGSDDFSTEAKERAARDLTAAAAAGDLRIPIAARYPLSEIARSHEHVDSGVRGRVLVTIADSD